jgi:branched-chain amino acid transport system ATP-binding protein
MLRVENLTKRYYGLTAVDDVSYRVAQGEIVGLIGPNGSGKSTSIDCISGFAKPDHGRWWLQDVELTGLSPERISLAGLTRSFQTVRAYDELTLTENLTTAAQAADGVGWAGALFRTPACRAAEARARDRARMLLAIAAAMMAHPKLVVLDEPVAGVNPTMIRRIEDAIHTIRREGVTLLVVEHNVDFIMAICDRIVVLEAGQKIADGSPDLIHSDERVLAAYLGRKRAAEVAGHG